MKSFSSGLVAAFVALTAGAAMAADMPVKVPYQAPAAYSWTGFYLGGHVGVAWSDARYLSNHVSGVGPCIGGNFITPCDAVHHRVGSLIGGGQVGARWQTGNWVLGLEGSFAATHLKKNTPSAIALVDYTSELRSFYTATVQAGRAWDRTLWYVKGGYAGGRLHFDSNSAGVVAPVSTNAKGWTIGTGLEHVLFSTVSVGVEYDYARLTGGASTCSTPGSVFSCPVPPGLTLRYANYAANIHQVIARFNYKFGPEIFGR